MKNLESRFLAFNRWLLILILAAMAVIIFANVALRYTTDASIAWAEEVARYLMIWLTFLGCGPVLRHGGHIAVENLQEALPRRGAMALRACIALLMLALFVFFIWFGLEYMSRTRYQLTPSTQVPFAYIYAALPLGMAVTVVHWLLFVRRYVLQRAFATDSHFDATASASL